MSFNEIYFKLHINDRMRLLYALENGIPQFVEYTKGKYIGVNCEHNPCLRADEQHAQWAIGTIEESRIHQER